MIKDTLKRLAITTSIALGSTFLGACNEDCDQYQSYTPGSSPQHTACEKRNAQRQVERDQNYRTSNEKTALNLFQSANGNQETLSFFMDNMITFKPKILEYDPINVKIDKEEPAKYVLNNDGLSLLKAAREGDKEFTAEVNRQKQNGTIPPQIKEQSLHNMLSCFGTEQNVQMYIGAAERDDTNKDGRKAIKKNMITCLIPSEEKTHLASSLDF